MTWSGERSSTLAYLCVLWMAASTLSEVMDCWTDELGILRRHWTLPAGMSGWTESLFIYVLPDHHAADSTDAAFSSSPRLLQ